METESGGKRPRTPLLPHHRTYSSIRRVPLLFERVEPFRSAPGRFPGQRRGRLKLLARSSSGSAFAACAGAHALPRALLPLSALRESPSAPCNRGFGPLSAPPPPTMASLGFSAPFPSCCQPGSPVCPDRRRDLPGQVLSPSLGTRRIHPRVCPDDYWASPSDPGLPHHAGLPSGFCSSGPSLAIGLASGSTSQRRPCPWLTVGPASPVEDFPFQVSAHAGRTQRKAGLQRSQPFLPLVVSGSPRAMLGISGS